MGRKSRDTERRRQNIRTVLLFIILGTIPCYLLALIVWFFPNQGAEPTATPPPTWTPIDPSLLRTPTLTWTPIDPAQLRTPTTFAFASNTPFIVPTFSFVSTNTPTATLFVFLTNTPTPSATPTLTHTPTIPVVAPSVTLIPTDQILLPPTDTPSP